MKRFLALMLIVSVSFFSCGFPRSYVNGIEAFYKANSGEYQDALLIYLKMQDREAFKPWVNYNIANIYQRFSENNAALNILSSFPNVEENELMHYVNFNKGVAYYSIGDYENAKKSFIKALEYKRDDFSTKKNLELSIRKIKSISSLENFENRTLDKSAANEENKDDDADNEKILEYVKKREEQLWILDKKQDVKVSTEKDW